MANEYLRRTPTSTGNRRVWTWSTWVKRNSLTATNQNLLCSTEPGLISKLFFNTSDKLDYQNNSPSFELITSQTFRDVGNWFHILFVAETTASISSERIRLYVNGTRITKFDTETYPAINSNLIFNYPIGHFISKESSATNWFIGEFADIFFVDGQALTPDVFGFYKQGKGYISAGSTQATDFRPGQWVPKTPRVIKTEINRRGGFGVNGFYLPMNDSKNFGADFHGEPNSIITLNEKLPQPRVGVASTASVGLGYTDALRADPYAANLVLALPFVSGGLQSGFGDYAPSIKGSGTPKTMSSGSVSIASTASYYGSSANFQNSNSYVDTPGTSGDFNMGTGDFTIEGWFYPTGNGGNARLFGQNTNTYNAWDVYIDGSSATGQLYMMGSAYQLTSANIQGNQWNHVAISRKNLVWTTYINGVAAGIVTSIVNNTVGDSTYKFRVGAIGENAYGGVGYGFQGYIQDFRVYKGVAKYTGGFDVPRPYTPVGIATWRQVPDTTANNYATMNPLIGATPRSGGTITSTIVTYTDGNLTTRNSANAGYAPAMQSHSNVGITTGKWYWECSNFSTTSNEFFGISKGNEQITPNGSGSGVECSLSYSATSGSLVVSSQYDGSYRLSATLNNTPGTAISSTLDVIGFAFDATNSSLSVYRNGVLNNTATGIAATSNVREWFITKGASSSSAGSGMSWNFGQNPTFSGNTTAGTFTDSNGKGLFKYQPPSGFLALCEDNLPTPAISDPGKHFKTMLYTGTGASRNIVGVGFTPDLVWIKERNGADNHRLVDSVRGPIRELYSSLTNAEVIDSGAILSFDSDGFSLGNSNSYNESGINHVAWCWRAGAGTTSTNTNGSITSVVSVNQDAGFSIVSYRGTGANATVGHGLGKKPAFMVFKQRNQSDGWIIYHQSITATKFLQWDTDPAASLSTFLNNTEPTSSVFSLGSLSNSNDNGWPIIAYCWAEIEGFSKFGSFTGNASTDGVFVYTGFRPALVIIKRTDTTDSWAIFDSSRDSANPVERLLRAESSNAEATMTSLVSNPFGDFLSNGFKVRNTSTIDNASGGSYIFAAWAESPFQTANSK